MEMERFNYKVRERDQVAVALILDLAKAFERVSLPVVWAWATQFNFSKKTLRVLCGHFEHQRCVQCEGCVAEPLETITASLPQSMWRRGHQNYPPLKLWGFVDDITASINGRNKEAVEMAEEVLKKLKREVEEKGLKLSITEGGK